MECKRETTRCNFHFENDGVIVGDRRHLNSLEKKKLESIRTRVFIFSPNDRVADGHMLKSF